MTEPTEPDDIANLRVKANAGDADAQYKLGYAYSEGQGVPQDSAQASSWVRKAAEQGHAWACWNVGRWYAEAMGVPQDNAQIGRAHV